MVIKDSVAISNWPKIILRIHIPSYRIVFVMSIYHNEEPNGNIVFVFKMIANDCEIFQAIPLSALAPPQGRIIRFAMSHSTTLRNTFKLRS